MSASTGRPVMHFEIGCRDLEKTSAFYTNLFGWSPTPIPHAVLLNLHASAGITGHITALGHEPYNYVTVYIEVDDILKTLEEIERAGGKKIVGPIPLPSGNQFAWFHDPEGNLVGLRTKPATS